MYIWLSSRQKPRETFKMNVTYCDKTSRLLVENISNFLKIKLLGLPQEEWDPTSCVRSWLEHDRYQTSPIYWYWLMPADEYRPGNVTSYPNKMHSTFQINYKIWAYKRHPAKSALMLELGRQNDNDLSNTRCFKELWFRSTNSVTVSQLNLRCGGMWGNFGGFGVSCMWCQKKELCGTVFALLMVILLANCAIKL